MFLRLGAEKVLKLLLLFCKVIRLWCFLNVRLFNLKVAETYLENILFYFH